MEQVNEDIKARRSSWWLSEHGESMKHVVKNGHNQEDFSSSEDKVHWVVHLSFPWWTGLEVLSADTIMMTLKTEAWTEVFKRHSRWRTRPELMWTDVIVMKSAAWTDVFRRHCHWRTRPELMWTDVIMMKSEAWTDVFRHHNDEERGLNWCEQTSLYRYINIDIPDLLKQEICLP